MSGVLTTLKGIFSGDTLVLVVLVAVFVGYAMWMGRGRILSLLLAFYPSIILFNSFPFVNQFLVMDGDMGATLNKLGVFLLFLIPISIVLNRFLVSFSEHTGAAHFVRLIGFGVAGTALLLILSYGTLNLDPLHNFSPTIDTLFNSGSKVFYWNVGVLALLGFL